MSDIKKNDYSSENEDKNIISDVAHEEPLPIAQDVAAPRRRHGGASPV
jgi:hypothetical protein